MGLVDSSEGSYLKPYLLSLGVGLLIGVIYSSFGVRSPAPPVIALVGLLGILLGEKVVPTLKGALENPGNERVHHEASQVEAKRAITEEK